MKVQYQPVESTNLAAIGYADGHIFVEFIGGRRFSYPAPEELFDKLKAAKSKGSFFDKNIKKPIPIGWNGQRCTDSPCQNDATLVGLVGAIKIYLCPECAKKGRYAKTSLGDIHQRFGKHEKTDG